LEGFPEEKYGDLRFSWFAFRLEPALWNQKLCSNWRSLALDVTELFKITITTALLFHRGGAILKSCWWEGAP